MARLVVPGSKSGGTFAEGAPPPADGYSERLLKYLPAETIAFYVGVDRLIAAHFGIDGTSGASGPAFAWSIGLFALGLVGTFFYLRSRRVTGQPWGLNASIATLAFVVWAYTLGGTPFLLTDTYSLFAAGLATPIFTFVAGFIAPAET